MKMLYLSAWRLAIAVVIVSAHLALGLGAASAAEPHALGQASEGGSAVTAATCCDHAETGAMHPGGCEATGCLGHAPAVAAPQAVVLRLSASARRWSARIDVHLETSVSGDTLDRPPIG